MAEARGLTPEEEENKRERKVANDLANRMKDNRILRRFFVGLLMDNVIHQPFLKFYQGDDKEFSDQCDHSYMSLLLNKGNLIGDKKTDYYTGRDAKEIYYPSDQLFSESLNQAYFLSRANMDPTGHGLIQKIREWVSFLDPRPVDFPVLELKPKEAKSTMRRDILDELIKLAQQSPKSGSGTTPTPPSYPTDNSGSRSPYSPPGRAESKAPISQNEDSEQDKISATHLARELLRNIWDPDTLHILMAYPLNQHIIGKKPTYASSDEFLDLDSDLLEDVEDATNEEVKEFKEKKELLPNLFRQEAPSLPPEYIETILFLNKKLKVFEKIKEYINEYKPTENRKNTAEALQRNILAAKTVDEIVNAFLKAIPDIEKEHGWTIQGSNLYKNMQEACNKILGKNINLLKEYNDRKISRSAGPGPRPPGNAAADG